MAGKKATSKNARAASPKKAPAKPAKAARRKSQGRSSAKRSARAAAKRATKGTSKKVAKRTRLKGGAKSAPVPARQSPRAATDQPEAPGAGTTRASAAPAGPPSPPAIAGNPARGERALLGRGPWWWRESLTKTTPEAPNAASYRRGRVDEPDFGAVPLKPTPTPIDPEALAPRAGPDDDEPPMESDRPRPDAAGPPAPQVLAEPAPAEEPLPDLDSAPPPDAVEALAALVAREITQPVEALPIAEGAAITDPPETPPFPEALDTSTPDGSEVLDEVLEALKVLEGTGAPPTVEPPQDHEETSPADDPAGAEATTQAPEVAGPDTPQGDGDPTDVEPPGPGASEPEVEIAEASAPASDAEPTAPAPDEPRTIEQLDDEVSGNLDRLLHGEFESVDELLEGEFDEPAPVRDESAEPEEAAEPREAAATDSETHVEREHAEAGLVDDPLDDPPGDSKPEGARDPADFLDADEPDREPQRARAAARDKTDDADAWRPDVAARPKRTAEKGAADPDDESSSTELLIALLQWANTPRRRLSPSARMIVDWIALSLLFWVPVVWVFALVVAN